MFNVSASTINKILNSIVSAPDKNENTEYILNLPSPLAIEAASVDKILAIIKNIK